MASSNNTSFLKYNDRVCLIQVGARLHYAAPEVLARQSRLAALITDATEATGGKLTEQILRLFVPHSYARLKGRSIPAAISREVVHSSLLPTLQLAAAEKLGPRIVKSARVLHRYGLGGHQLSRLTIKNNFFGARTLYVHPCTATDALIEAKKRGMTTIIEAVSHPLNKKVEFSECIRYGVRSDQSYALIEDNIAFFKDEIEYADIVLAASAYVRSGLLAIGLQEHRVRIVPYGLDANFAQGMKSVPKIGRVLYVGAVNYLKGIPTLAAAAKILAKQDSRVVVDAVGPLAPGVAGRPEFEGLNYLGQVPRAVVREHFSSSDVFVFPTLSDGFGLVILEAMSAGLPVICTENCADLVEDGVNGYIVPARDAEALAAAVAKIVCDRTLRARMSLAARQTAARNTLKNYADALVDAVDSVRLVTA